MQHQVEQRVVEGRQAQLRHEGQRHARGEDDAGGVRFISLSCPGLKSRITISSVNETIGAHDGAVTAMVTASLTPITMPATSGPSALPSPPSITAANTTPTHA